MHKNDLFFGTCTDYTYNGLGVVKNGTFCVFVKDMLVGESGKIIVTAVRRDYGYGRLLELETASKERVEPRCPVSRQCGGCQLQHMSYSEQCRFKQNHVTETLKRIGQVETEVNPIIPLDDPWKYRNKVILPVGTKDGKTVTGFYLYNSHDIIPMENCCLQSDYANRLADKVRELLDRYELTSEVRNIMIRDFSATGEAMVVLVTVREEVPHLGELAEELAENEPAVRSVIQNINPEETNVVLGKKEKVLYGSESIRDRLAGLEFEVASHSFYQVNTRQTARLYGEAIRMAALKKNETALDLYCGVGTIGMLASRDAGKIIGVEIVPEAVENARKNADINHIDNIEFICGDALKAVRMFAEKGQRPDVVFVDPPRKGCNEEVLECIVKMQPDRIVYVSCEPSTLARDLLYLQNNGYRVKEVQPVDMFSQTFHVETVCLLVH
ncbi:MAG: 23S rRNA (uracil(1939)-C(5))-methyltransferase RlmD [Erysipelotrichaceae bacterium]|nr:23S rRNA (uracil(1939)-C(5))-methyltransferase RlmD [Erysipelotrichaceae bacterium]